MRLPGRFAAFALVLSLPALAQQAKPAPPKPNPALTDAFKDMAGTWACTGTMDNPQAPGNQLKTQGEMKIASELDGFAYTGMYRMEKNAAMPIPMKARFEWGWDDGKKTLVEFGFDNIGSNWSGTSPGMKDGAMVWTDEGAMMGQPSKTRTTVTKKSPREITVLTEIENKGAWQKMGEDRCKKK